MLSFVENKESTRCSQWIFLICLFWLLLALLLFTASNPALYHRPFGMEHAWVSAHFAVIARTFAEYGVFGLHGIPIQNNGLLSGRPDVYLHWPPLFGILLSQLNLLFGASENTAYGMMFTIMLMNALLLFLIARRLSSTEAGLLSAFAWFALPINIKFGYLVLHLNFAITMVLLAILFLVRRIQNVGLHAVNTAFGCCAIAIATLTSWEPVLMTSGLWLAVWLANVPQLRMTLAAYMITAIAIASGVLAWYSFMYPEMASDIIHAVLRRLNLAREAPSIDDIYNMMSRDEISSFKHQVITFVFRFHLLGAVGMIAIAALWFDTIFGSRDARDLSLWVTTVGLSVLWLIWAMVMRQHYTIHNYETVTAAPLIALASGLFIWRIIAHVKSWQQGQQRHVALLVMLCATPSVMALDLLEHAYYANAVVPPIPLISYGKSINQHTINGDIVISTSQNMVPVYYSNRHIIRGIEDEQQLALVLPKVTQVSGTRNIYLAIEPKYTEAFLEAKKKFKTVFEDNDIVIFKLN